MVPLSANEKSCRLTNLVNRPLLFGQGGEHTSTNEIGMKLSELGKESAYHGLPLAILSMFWCPPPVAKQSKQFFFFHQ
jgi:hypothetical protein